MRSAPFTKTAAACRKDMHQAVQLWAQASLADNIDAQVEYAIALYNGDGVARNEDAAAANLPQGRAKHGSPIAQDRLRAHHGQRPRRPADPVKAVKWHLVSRAGGETDITLDDFMAKLDAATVAEGTKQAKPWIDALKQAQAARAATGTQQGQAQVTKP